MSVRIGVDIGGTFTDEVAIADDRTEATAKSLSATPNVARGVMAAVVRLGVETVPGRWSACRRAELLVGRN